MAGRKVFQAATVLTAADVNSYLMDQSVMSFAGTAARASAIGTATEGMVTYLQDSNSLEFWNGSQWQNVNDNTASVPLNTVTAAGDLIVANGSASVTRLAIGTANSIPYSNGSALTYLAPGLSSQVLTVGTAGNLGWASPSGGGSIWFNVVYSASTQSRYNYPLAPGYYWFTAYDKNGSAGPSGNILAYNSAMSAVGTASLSASADLGQTNARLNLAGSATYLIFDFPEDVAVLLTSAGAAQPADTNGVPTVYTTSGTVVLTQTSTVYLIGGGGAGSGKPSTTYDSRGGGGSGYVTTLNSVAAGTYVTTIGAGGASANNFIGANGGSTIFGSLGTALGGNGGTTNAAGGNGGSGGGGGRNSVPNVAAAGANGGVNGANGGSGNEAGGTGSGVTLPWFLKSPAAATSPSDGTAQGGGLYGGGAAGPINLNLMTSGGGGSLGGGGGGAGGLRANSTPNNTPTGGAGGNGVIYVIGA